MAYLELAKKPLVLPEQGSGYRLCAGSVILHVAAKFQNNHAHWRQKEFCTNPYLHDGVLWQSVYAHKLVFSSLLLMRKKYAFKIK